jgi:ABC-type sugar transport system permease subunit
MIKRLTSRKRGSYRNRMSLSEILVFVVPTVFFLLILYGTLAWTVYVSFTDWKTVAPNYTFTGLKWYQFIVQQPRFKVDIPNNLAWLILGVVPTVAVAILIAYILLGYVGIDSPLRYTTNPKTATYWLILIFIWQYLGFSVIIIQSSFRTAELQEMIEAATVDGASRMRTLISVILPNIRSGLLVLVSLLLISTLKVFDIVYIVTFGGPGISTDVLALNMWITSFQQHLVSAGAGLGVIIFLIAFIIVIPYTIYALRRWFE